MESGFKVVPESRLLTIIFTLILNSSCTIREETFLWTVDESSVPEGECQYECSVFTFTFSFLTFATFFEPNLPSPYVSSSLLILSPLQRTTLKSCRLWRKKSLPQGLSGSFLFTRVRLLANRGLKRNFYFLTAHSFLVTQWGWLPCKEPVTRSWGTF